MATFREVDETELAGVEGGVVIAIIAILIGLVRPAV